MYAAPEIKTIGTLTQLTEHKNGVNKLAPSGDLIGSGGIPPIGVTEPGLPKINVLNILEIS